MIKEYQLSSIFYILISKRVPKDPFHWYNVIINKPNTNAYNYTKLARPRQLVLPLDYGILIKEAAPVRLLDAVLEELNYTELQHLYSSKGRKSNVPPHILLKIFIYAMSEGVYSTRAIQKQCEENINYMWLYKDILHQVT